MSTWDRSRSEKQHAQRLRWNQGQDYQGDRDKHREYKKETFHTSILESIRVLGKWLCLPSDEPRFLIAAIGID